MPAFFARLASWSQVYNEFNARSIGSKANVWSGVLTNAIFLTIVVVTIGVQIFVVEVGGR